MRRRRLLSLLAGGTAGIAGCQTSPRTGAESSEPPSGGTEPTDGSERSATVESSAESGSTEVDSPIEVGIETAQYLLYADVQPPEYREIAPDDIVPRSELPASLRSALDDARDGGFETDEASAELLSAIDRFRHHGIGYRFQPYVDIEGTPVAFNPTVPVFTARLVTVGPERTDPSRTVEHEDIETFAEPVGDFVRTIGAFSAEAPRDEYRISVLPDAVRDVLDSYDYVDDAVGTARIRTERVDPGPPYSIEIRELTAEDLWGRPVLDSESLDGALRAFLRRVVESNRRAAVHEPELSEYRTDEVPAAYADRLRPESGGIGPFVDIDGTKYIVRLEEPRRDRLPVAVSASPETDDDSLAFRLVLEPSEAGQKPTVRDGIELEATGALPSVLWIEPDGDRQLLPSDAYDSVRWEPPEESATAPSTASDVDRRARNIDREFLPLEETLSVTYRIPDSVPAGTHRAWGRFGVSWTDDETGEQYPRLDYPFQVAVTVRRG
jgi:hypothetical protein